MLLKTKFCCHAGQVQTALRSLPTWLPTFFNAAVALGVHSIRGLLWCKGWGFRVGPDLVLGPWSPPPTHTATHSYRHRHRHRFASSGSARARRQYADFQ